MKLISWLRRFPQPVAVLCDDKRIEVPKGPRKWAELTESVETIDPEKLQAIDADGKVLRAKTFERSDDDDGETKKSQKSSDLQTFATLLAQAYQNGASAHSAAYALAFQENTKLVGLLANRLGALEAAWQKSLHHNASLLSQLAQVQAAGEGDGDESIIAQMFAGWQAAQLQKQNATPDKKPNGKAAKS